MKVQRPLAIAIGLLMAVAALPARAEVKLPAVIGENMVLQRGQPLPVWGWDDPGAAVTVVLGEARVAAKADADGKWKVELPAMQAGGPHTMQVSGTTTVTVKNVLVGEVWLCSGQSNMEWRVRQTQNAEQEIAAADYPRIRHIKILHRPADAPQNNVDVEPWQVCSPATVGDFTAVGYFFARTLQDQLDVPIGLIGCNWGGTRIEPWTAPVGFQQVPALKEIADNLASYPAKRDNGAINHQSPLALYNGMVNPLVPYAMQGSIWYQGEANNGEGMLYHEKMKALIGGWRAIWGRKDMPFYYVQLAPYRYRGDPLRLPALWEAQLATLQVPHTGMAVTVDIGNLDDIHPRNKQDVGRRLALWALAKTYGEENLVYSGPLYQSMQVEGDCIRIHFNHVGTGLVSRDGKPLNWFAIAGADKQFVDAQCEIDGDTVVVHADAVDKPIAVRFGWHQEAQPNLANKEGLPASPFRTDDW